MSTEQEVKNLITKKKKIHTQRITRALGISTGYAIFICQALQRRGEIDYSGGWASVKGFKEKKRIKEIKPVTRKKKAISKKAPRKRKVEKVKKKIEKKKLPVAALKKEVTPKLAKKLKNSGYKTVEDVAEAPLAMLMQRVKISLKIAARIINEARRKLRKISRA